MVIFGGIQNNLRIRDSSRLSCGRVRVVPLEIFIPRKLGMGFFFFLEGGGGLSFGPGIFLGFDFCPHSFIPVT